MKSEMQTSQMSCKIEEKINIFGKMLTFLRLASLHFILHFTWKHW